MKVRNIVKNIIIGVSIAVLLWIIGSYIDIQSHNMVSHVYAPWNFFTLLAK